MTPNKPFNWTSSVYWWRFPTFNDENLLWSFSDRQLSVVKLHKCCLKTYVKNIWIRCIITLPTPILVLPLIDASFIISNSCVADISKRLHQFCCVVCRWKRRAPLSELWRLRTHNLDAFRQACLSAIAVPHVEKTYAMAFHPPPFFNFSIWDLNCHYFIMQHVSKV